MKSRVQLTTLDLHLCWYLDLSLLPFLGWHTVSKSGTFGATAVQFGALPRGGDVGEDELPSARVDASPVLFFQSGLQLLGFLSLAGVFLETLGV